MRPVLFAAALLVLPLSAARAQYTLARESRLAQHDSAARAVAARLQADLTGLRQAEDAYFAAHGTYTADLAALPAFRPASGGAVRVARADRGGWAAVATHPALPGSEERLTVTRAVAAASPGRR